MCYISRSLIYTTPQHPHPHTNITPFSGTQFDPTILISSLSPNTNYSYLHQSSPLIYTQLQSLFTININTNNTKRVGQCLLLDKLKSLTYTYIMPKFKRTSKHDQWERLQFLRQQRNDIYASINPTDNWTVELKDRLTLITIEIEHLQPLFTTTNDSGTQIVRFNT